MNFASVFNPKIIFQSWVDSLKIFLPANLIPFLSTTFKSFIEGLKAITFHVLWRVFVAGLAVIGIILLISYWVPKNVKAEVWSFQVIFILLWLMIVLLIAWILALRPRIGPKDYAYFAKHRLAVPGVALLFVGWFFIGLWIANYVAQFSYIITIMILKFLFLGFFLKVFFFIESTHRAQDIAKSFGQALIFDILNLPGLVVLGSISTLFGLFLSAIANLFSETDWAYWIFIGIAIIEIMISICILYNYFLVRVSEHKSLYW